MRILKKCGIKTVQKGNVHSNCVQWNDETKKYYDFPLKDLKYTQIRIFLVTFASSISIECTWRNTKKFSFILSMLQHVKKANHLNFMAGAIICICMR